MSQKQTLVLDLKNLILNKAVKATLVSYNKASASVVLQLHGAPAKVELYIQSALPDADTAVGARIGSDFNIESDGTATEIAKVTVKDTTKTTRTSGCSAAEASAAIKGL